MHLARAHRKVETLDDGGVGHGHVQVLDLEQRCGGHGRQCTFHYGRSGKFFDTFGG